MEKRHPLDTDASDALTNDARTRCANIKKGVSNDGKVQINIPTSTGAEGLTQSYLTGWGMLNDTANFEITGMAEVEYNTTTCKCEVNYTLTFKWHDIMDANHKYPGDSALATVISGTDYPVTVEWTGKAHFENGGIENNTGWPLKK
jgi:hypothetical protein